MNRRPRTRSTLLGREEHTNITLTWMKLCGATSLDKAFAIMKTWPRRMPEAVGLIEYDGFIQLVIFRSIVVPQCERAQLSFIRYESQKEFILEGDTCNLDIESKRWGNTKYREPAMHEDKRRVCYRSLCRCRCSASRCCHQPDRHRGAWAHAKLSERRCLDPLWHNLARLRSLAPFGVQRRTA